MTNIALIAKGLSKAQREIVLQGDDRGKPAYAFRSDHDGRKASGLIRKSRLFIGKMGGAQVTLWSLSDRGLLVKSYLERNPND